MGSRFSKAAVQAHGKATATPIATTLSCRGVPAHQTPSCPAHLATNSNNSSKNVIIDDDDDDDNNNNNDSNNNIDEAAFTTTTPVILLHPRHSVPATPPTAAATADSEASVLTHRDLTSGSTGLDPTVMAPPPRVPNTPENRAPAEPEVQCLACCKPLPNPKHPNYAEEVVQPCRSCESEYCTACVRAMFVNASKSTTRMPPRCCVQIHLHHARPYLSPEEVAVFKAKYEEWSTLKPFYCPVPRCSTFIPDRLLPVRPDPSKKRADSGMGTPMALIFPCPSCATEVCLGCRQIAHPGSMCVATRSGVNIEMSALLKSWGYKQCPKCGHGLKRMFGCSHMECRCGAQFCWGCLNSRDACYGGCSDDDETEDELLTDSDEVDVNEGDDSLPLVNTPNSRRTPPATTGGMHVPSKGTLPEISVPEYLNGVQELVRQQNLDSGSQRYWEEQELDFGREPDEDIPDRSWDCSHAEFFTHEITLSMALSTYPSSADMECTKCWTTIYPDIKPPPPTSHAAQREPKILFGRYVQRNRTVRRTSRQRRRWDMQPRGLYRNGATVGTAPHLTTPIPSMSKSMPAREAPSSMGDIHYAATNADNHRTSISTTEPGQRGRTSVASAPPAGTTNTSNKVPPSHFFSNSPSSSSFSLAHECLVCGLLVCDTCKAACCAAAST